ncbi:M1 family aminopeptidase [Kaistella palustris]|uniref:M1 family aminopeptidase n=1 Tax=Kaistella palustris TaxID=493376 RepID=UPI0003F81801|nr:M1 family aminopeptidase [Kaistella palustris]
MKKFYFSVLGIFCFAFTFAQNHADQNLINREVGAYRKMINFNINPNTLNYDLKYQRLEADLDPAQLFISGTVTSHFLPSESFSQIYFDLTNLLTVSQVTYHGAALTFEQLPTKELKINFNTALPAHVLDSLTIKYSGVPDSSAGTSFYAGTHNGSPVLSTLSEPYGAQNWFPTKQSMNDKIDSFDLKITAPAQYSVGANGKLMSETVLPGNKKLTFWRTQYPTAAYLIAFSLGDFIKTNGEIGNSSFPYLNYLYPDTSSSPAVQSNLEWTKEAMTVFETYFGPYPFSAEKYGHMEFAVNGAAMEHQTMSSMNSFARSTIAHELAHQWFGDKITCGAWNDAWLNEGFATFAEQLIFEKNLMTHGEFMAHLAGQISNITSLPNGRIYVADSDLSNVSTVFNGRLTYVKGGFVLRMMKWILGDAAFYQMLKDYTANPAFAYQYAKTEDFKNQILQSTGKDFTEFFNDWIYGEGYPGYIIKWNQAAGNPNVQFLVSQSQSDPSVNFFELPLPVTVTGTNGETAELILENTSNSQAFSKTVNFPVAAVEFNKECQIIEKNSVVVFDPALAVFSGQKDEVLLYPNPVHNAFLLKGIAVNQEFIIYSVSGQIIKKGKYTAGNMISVKELPTGVYFLKIAGKNLKFRKE